MKLGIIVTDKEDWTALALTRAAAQIKNCEVFVMDLKDIHVVIEEKTTFLRNNMRLPFLDAVVVRDVGAGAMDGVSFRFDILRQFKMQGTLVLNSPEAIRNAANKYHTNYLLKNLNLPVPKTYVVQNIDLAYEIINKLQDAIIKPVFGYKGKGIIRIKNNKLLETSGALSEVNWIIKINEMLQNAGMLYIQEFIPNQGRDIRVYVLNGNVIGAIYRTAQKGYWINNLSQGAESDTCNLTPIQKKMCIKATEAVGTIFAGVDLIEGQKGFFILEVNGTPSGAGIYKSCGINVAEHILDYVLSKL